MILPLDLNLFLNQSVKQKLFVIKDKEYKIIWPWQMAMHIEIIIFYIEISNKIKVAFASRVLFLWIKDSSSNQHFKYLKTNYRDDNMYQKKIRYLYKIFLFCLENSVFNLDLAWPSENNFLQTIIAINIFRLPDI